MWKCNNPVLASAAPILKLEMQRSEIVNFEDDEQT